MAEKDKKYYWLKLKRDFFKRHDIQIIEDMDNGKDYILFYLKLLCESVDHEGNLRFSSEIPYSDKMLATITRTNVDVVRNAVNVFAGLGMMELLDDGTYYMSKIDEMMGSESYWAEKKRIQRNETKVLDNVQRESNECPTCPSKSIDIELDKDTDKELNKDTDKELNKEKEKDNKKTITMVLNSYAPSGSDLRSALDEFKEMRNKKKKPLTVIGLERALKKLDILSGGDETTKIEIVCQTLDHGWDTFWELKVSNIGSNYGNRKSIQQEADELAAFIDSKNCGE